MKRLKKRKSPAVDLSVYTFSSICVLRLSDRGVWSSLSFLMKGTAARQQYNHPQLPMLLHEQYVRGWITDGTRIKIGELSTPDCRQKPFIFLGKKKRNTRDFLRNRFDSTETRQTKWSLSFSPPQEISCNKLWWK